MALADKLIKKVDATLAKLAVSPKPAYKRVRVASGGDSLLGKGGTVTITDTLISPTPAFVSPGDGSVRELLGDTAVSLGDLVCISSVTGLSPTELETESLTIALKSGSDVDEYDIVKHQPYFIDGQTVATLLVLRIRKR